MSDEWSRLNIIGILHSPKQDPAPADIILTKNSDSLQRRLEVLQEAVARLENDKSLLEDQTLRLSETLQEVRATTSKSF